MNLIVTIPAYNEEKTIGKVINGIKNVLDNSKFNTGYKILVVDDGSVDRTAEIAKKSGAIVYSHPTNYGLAMTFRTEMKLCLKLGADIIVHMDADGQYLAGDILKLIEGLENGADLVLGSRFAGRIEYMTALKYLGNKAFSKVVSKITGLTITDSQTGFRAFTREVAQNIKLIAYHTYTQEQIIHAVKQNFRIKEVPIFFAKRSDGNSRLIGTPFEYAVKVWLDLFKIYRHYRTVNLFLLFTSSTFLVGGAAGLYYLFNSSYSAPSKTNVGLLTIMISFVFLGLILLVVNTLNFLTIRRRKSRQ